MRSLGRGIRLGLGGEGVMMLFAREVLRVCRLGLVALGYRNG